MLSYNILEDKTVNNIHYQLLERKDSIGSEYSIGIPNCKNKMTVSWELLVEWSTKNFTKRLFDDIKYRG